MKIQNIFQYLTKDPPLTYEGYKKVNNNKMMNDELINYKLIIK